MSRAPRSAVPAEAAGRRVWQRGGIWALLIVLSVGYALWGDLAHVRWSDALSREGSPPPTAQADSPTGFVRGQRHFLGTNQRGETYRWIAAVQRFFAEEPADRSHYSADTVPSGRPQLLSTLYTGWLALLAGLFHLAAHVPMAAAVERVAVWEPVLSHLLTLLAASVFMTRRFGVAWGGGTALLLALHPLATSQHVPGALSVDTWALWAAIHALACELTARTRPTGSGGFGIAPTVTAALSLSLNPAFGFPAVIILGVAGAVALVQSTARPFLRWSVLGAAIVAGAWALARAPLDPAASELRYVHPWYALAWLGIGLALDAVQRRRRSPERRRWCWAQAALGLLLIVPLVSAQVQSGAWGWLQPTADLQRLAPIDGSPIQPHIFAWLADAAWSERWFMVGPVLAGGVALGVLVRSQRRDRAPGSAGWISPAIVLGATCLLAAFQIRWLIAVALLSGPVLALAFTRVSIGWRRGLAAGGAAFLLALAAWGRFPPGHLRSPRPPAVPSATDLEALVFRHFSHWLSNQGAGRELRVLAPPAAADSLVYHGGVRVLLSSAWESHPGHVAAARILSAPEATEAEAVIESLGLTHLVLTSWDPVLPLLVKQPLEQDRDTLHDRLQRWVLPRYLRPLPYRLPATPGFEAEKLAVFEVVAPQDEALALSRLAEYFIEVGRPEPAGEVVKALDQAYPQDLNAMIARALYHEATGSPRRFQAEVDRLADSVARGLHPADEDRRLLRSIVLALGRRHELARPELAASCGRLSAEILQPLTPLQLFRLDRLVELYGLQFPQPELAELARLRSADYTR